MHRGERLLDQDHHQKRLDLIGSCVRFNLQFPNNGIATGKSFSNCGSVLPELQAAMKETLKQTTKQVMIRFGGLQWKIRTRAVKKGRATKMRNIITENQKNNSNRLCREMDTRRILPEVYAGKQPHERKPENWDQFASGPRQTDSVAEAGAIRGRGGAIFRPQREDQSRYSTRQHPAFVQGHRARTTQEVPLHIVKVSGIHQTARSGLPQCDQQFKNHCQFCFSWPSIHLFAALGKQTHFGFLLGGRYSGCCVPRSCRGM